MDLELCQLDRRYEALRSRSTKLERRLLSSLAEVGQQQPIVVVRDAERWVVVDGYKRLRALARLSQDLVRAAEWTLLEADALLLERVLRMGDGDSPLEQGWFLCELTTRFGLALEELARRLDRSKSWVSRRVGLVKDLPQAVQEQVRRGNIGAHAAMKYLLPLARANAADCAQISAALAKDRPTSRELGQLYATYMAGNRATRDLVVNKPQVVLRARAAGAEGASDATPMEHVLDDLRIVAAVAHRVRGRLVRGALDGVTEEERGRVQQGVVEAGDAVRRLEAATKRELKEDKPHAGSIDTSSHSATE